MFVNRLNTYGDERVGGDLHVAGEIYGHLAGGKVYHDATLSGDGISGSPLSVISTETPYWSLRTDGALTADARETSLQLPVLNIQDAESEVRIDENVLSVGNKAGTKPYILLSTDSEPLMSIHAGNTTNALQGSSSAKATDIGRIGDIFSISNTSPDGNNSLTLMTNSANISVSGGSFLVDGAAGTIDAKAGKKNKITLQETGRYLDMFAGSGREYVEMKRDKNKFEIQNIFTVGDNTFDLTNYGLDISFHGDQGSRGQGSISQNALYFGGEADNKNSYMLSLRNSTPYIKIYTSDGVSNNCVIARDDDKFEIQNYFSATDSNTLDLTKDGLNMTYNSGNLTLTPDSLSISGANYRITRDDDKFEIQNSFSAGAHTIDFGNNTFQLDFNTMDTFSGKIHLMPNGYETYMNNSSSYITNSQMLGKGIDIECHESNSYYSSLTMAGGVIDLISTTGNPANLHMDGPGNEIKLDAGSSHFLLDSYSTNQILAINAGITGTPGGLNITRSNDNFSISNEFATGTGTYASMNLGASSNGFSFGCDGVGGTIQKTGISFGFGSGGFSANRNTGLSIQFDGGSFSVSAAGATFTMGTAPTSTWTFSPAGTLTCQKNGGEVKTVFAY
jgi:hypothetical protein